MDLFISLVYPFLSPDEEMGRNAKSEMMCPRFPEPLPLEHPIPSLKEALEKVSAAQPSCKVKSAISPSVAQVCRHLQSDHGNPSHQMSLHSTEGD